MHTGPIPHLVLIGSLRADNVCIHVTGHVPPDQIMPEDGKWVTCQISTNTHCFSGEFDANIRLEDLQMFLDQVRLVLDGAGDKADFDTPEDWLAVHFFPHPNGTFEASYSLASRTYPPSSLRSSIILDRAGAEVLIKSLQETILDWVE